MIDFATSKPHNKVSKSIYFLFNSSNSRDRLPVSGLKRGKEKHHQFSFTYSQPFHSLKSWHEKNGKLKLNAPLQFADTRLMDWVCASVFPSVCLPPCDLLLLRSTKPPPRSRSRRCTVSTPKRRMSWSSTPAMSSRSWNAPISPGGKASWGAKQACSPATTPSPSEEKKHSSRTAMRRASNANSCNLTLIYSKLRP